MQTDFAKGVKFSISEPIISFKETIVGQVMTEKRKKVKGAWEEVDSESEDEQPEEEKKEEEKTLADIMAEFEKLNQEVQKEREFLRKEMKPDMYIEKILFNKYYKNNPKALAAMGYQRSCATDRTADQRCQIKVRAVALDFEVTKWLEGKSKELAIVHRVAEEFRDGSTPSVDNIKTAY